MAVKSFTKFVQINEKYFPFGGDRVTVWLAGLDYVNELEQVSMLQNFFFFFVTDSTEGIS